MEIFFVLFIIFAVLSALGSLAGWVFVIWLAKKAVTAAVGNLDSLLPQITAQLHAYRSMPPAQRGNKNQEIVAMMLKAQQQMRQINDVHRARYEAKVGE